LSNGSDQARVAMAVRGDPAGVFDAFTREIELWWRRGPRFRSASGDQGLICLEPRLGGRVAAAEVMATIEASGSRSINLGAKSCH
jgi:hypothetical protein